MSLLLATSGDIASGVVEAEGVDFDGVNDYLSRSTDLVGNVDSKTFTFSAWVYTTTIEPFIISIGGASRKFSLNLEELGAGVRIRLTALNSSNTTILSVTDSEILPLNTFVHISISIDLTSTLKRHIYVNYISRTGLSWNTYTNSAIDFATSTFPITIGAYSDGCGFKLKGRLSNLFLDYTYRDLSIEANRRLFITADGKPAPTATLKALNPILYLPMKDAATAHINEGTGGNFTLNGTIATSERGANQDNCVASYFDGSADYLSRTSLTGIADGKQFTFSCTFKTDVIELRDFLNFGGTSTGQYTFFVKSNSTNGLSFAARNTISTPIFSATISSGVVIGKNDLLTISVDLSNINNRHIYINGIEQVVTWTTYIDDNIDFTTINYRIGCSHLTTPNEFWKGNIGELYFDTKYIDLSTNNPFWDATTNKPVPVRKVIADTGVTPLIAMPLDASNAGKNYGTGGDFTANSAPYVGARGGSEFWARSAKFDGSTGYLSRGALTGAVDSKTFSFVLPIYKTTNTTAGLLQGLSPTLYFVYTSANQIQVYARNPSNSIVLNAITSEGIPINNWGLLFVCIDMNNIANRFIYFGNTAQTVTWSTYTNDLLGFNNTGYRIGNQTSNYLNGSGHGFYFTTDYIDFSQEVNRLKFVDAMNFPTDIGKKIEEGIIPKPLIYLPFDDPSNLGKNLGTGGNFTVNGTVTHGSDVLG